MEAENRFFVIDPRLSKTGGEILASAIEHSANQGNPMATIESLFFSIVSHKKVAPVARMVGIEPDFLDLAKGTKPVPEGATMLWDGEVQTAIYLAHNRALGRGAKKAGIIDLLEVTTQHEAIRDLFFLTPERLSDIDRIGKVLVSIRSNRPAGRLAS